jgi:hypothetical protein
MKTIGIAAPFDSSGYWKLLDALGETFNVCFKEQILGNDSGIDAWLLPEINQNNRHIITSIDHPLYAVISSNQSVMCANSSEVEFSRNPTLASVLRGRQFRTDGTGELKVLPATWLTNVEVLATKAKSPVWAMQKVNGNEHHYVSWKIPQLGNGESLSQYFQKGKFIRLVPLLHFLRRLTEDPRWEPPPLHACFMFDDPNLHWPTYGFIDFAEIAQHAERCNYHASFATIPLDAWFTHRPTASLFKKHHDHLSLLIHGNDHIAQELAKPHSDEGCNQILKQALARITALEHYSGVEISKVMVPPHGACSESFLGAMARLGFEAACISGGSLRRYNNQAKWIHTIGIKPIDIIEGLPVLSRFRLSRDCHNYILAAALLNQPIIPVGHHYDTAEGLQILTEISEFINSLGVVQWLNMKKISRLHFARMIDGDTLRVKMFTKRIEILVPEEIKQIWVEQAWLKENKSEPLAWRVSGQNPKWQSQPSAEPLPAQPGQQIEIISNSATLPIIDSRPDTKQHLWPYGRRFLTETRDRLTPVLHKFLT